MKTVIIAHIPVIHAGYKKLFETHPEAKELYLLGEDFISDFKYLTKDIRRLDPASVKKLLEGWASYESISILDKNSISSLPNGDLEIIMPDDEISHEVARQYLTNVDVEFSPIFLQWDKHNSTKVIEVNPDRKISTEEFDREMIALSEKEAAKSSDIWRRIGSVLVKDQKVILTSYNQAMPGEQTPAFEGDPRNSFHKGDNLELSLFIHSEADVIAQAARKGISTEGSDIYVTTFPCPPCAKLIANSGVKRLFYKSGYGVLDGERILKDKGVEIIKVE